MDNAEARIELVKQFRTVQEKYDYWLMAVAASAIGLAVNETKDATFRLSQIWLGAAVLAWLVSFFASCRIQYCIKMMLSANNQYLLMPDGLDPIAGRNPQQIAIGMDVMESEILKQQRRAAFWSLLQFWPLVLGGLLYIVWHLVQMWLRTKAHA